MHAPDLRPSATLLALRDRLTPPLDEELPETLIEAVKRHPRNVAIFDTELPLRELHARLKALGVSAMVQRGRWLDDDVQLPPCKPEPPPWHRVVIELTRSLSASEQERLIVPWVRQVDADADVCRTRMICPGVGTILEVKGQPLDVNALRSNQKTDTPMLQLVKPSPDLISRLAELARKPRLPVNAFKRGDHAEIADEWLATGAAEVVTAEGSIWEYQPDKGVWSADSVEHRLRKDIVGLSGKAVETKNGEKPLRINHSDVEGIVKLVRLLSEDAAFFDDARRGIACENGFVTLDGIEPHAKEHRARAFYPLHFDPAAKSPAWERFLADLFRDDADAAQKIACLQEFFGGSLFGLATRFDECIVATGGGSNGKSTLVEIVRELFPADRVQAIPPKRWEHPFTLAEMVGTLLNIVGELPAGGILDSQHFKDMIAGDLVQAEKKFQPSFKFRPLAGHYFACNKLPATNDQTRGFWRRFIVIEFNRNFEGDTAKDTAIAEKVLATERAGILAWLVEGARRLLAQDGYTIPPSHERALRGWQTDTDSVKMFVDEWVDPAGKMAEYKARSVYSTYATWAKDGGYKPVAENKFKPRMVELGCEWRDREAGRVYSFALTKGKSLPTVN